MSEPISVWGSDVTPSLPEPVDQTQVLLQLGDTHVMTPDGMKLNMSAAVREEIFAARYSPNRDPGSV